MTDELEDVPVDDLLLIAEGSFTDESGERFACVYRNSIDAVTFVGAADEARLRERGVVEAKCIPKSG